MKKSCKLNAEALAEVAGGEERTISNSPSGFAYIRIEPDIHSRIIAKAYNGQKVSTTGVTEERDGYIWYQINLIGNYSSGWIMGQLIEDGCSFMKDTPAFRSRFFPACPQRHSRAETEITAFTKKTAESGMV